MPILTALRSMAIKSARRILMVDALQGLILLPLALRLSLASPARYWSISDRSCSGNSSHAGPVAALIGGSSKRCVGHPSIVPTQAFHVRAMLRRAALSAASAVVVLR